VPSTEERVIEIVCENLGVNKFEITIPDEQAEKIKTVGEAIDYIEREQAKK
jgi:acyl carrier protein